MFADRKMDLQGQASLYASLTNKAAQHVFAWKYSQGALLTSRKNVAEYELCGIM